MSSDLNIDFAERDSAGFDLGGVSRELFLCLCDELFGADSTDGLFMRFNDSPQSLVSHSILPL